MPSLPDPRPTNALGGQGAPSQACEEAFHLFPGLPAELQIQIWREAASLRRIVFVEPDTAVQRSISGDTICGRIPPLLHANHQSRQICLPIYSIRFQIVGASGASGAWETYILADHDILALRYDGLLHLLARCRSLSPYHGLSESTRSDWNELVNAIRSAPQFDVAAFRDKVTPALKARMQICKRPLHVSGVRGDISSAKRLILLRSDTARAEDNWPGLFCDPDILANLDRAFPATAVYNWTQPYGMYAASLSAAGVGPLPERYRCRPVTCPRHPGICDRQRPAVAVARTPLNLGQWLSALLFERSALRSFDLALGVHDMVVWRFSQPRYLTRPLPENASETEREFEEYAAHAQTFAQRVCWQMTTVYEAHKHLPWQKCKWRRAANGTGPGDDGVQDSELRPCWVCKCSFSVTGRR